MEHLWFYQGDLRDSGISKNTNKILKNKGNGTFRNNPPEIFENY